MKDRNEEKLDSIFDEKSLGQTLKRAKRFTLLRTLLVSAIVCILIGFGVYRVNGWWLDKTGSQLAHKLIQEDKIMKAPNTIVRTETIEFGLFKGTIKKEVFKVIEDKIIPWQQQDVHFGLRGHYSTSFSSYNTIIDDTTQVHIPSGEREMLFYVPQYKYKVYSNDLAALHEFPNDKYMELAISFDKAYSLSEAKEMLPKSIHQTWYWINDYRMESGSEAEPVSGQWIYGISQQVTEFGKALSNPKIKTEADFLNHLKKINKADYQFLKKQQKNGLIIGVVVTGTKEELLQLVGQPYVRASSLGAVVEKY